MKYIEKIEEDNEGNLIIKIPDELLEELGWKEGDELEVIVEDGYLILRKE